MTPLEIAARNLAHLAHADQRRRYTGEPYIVHPEAVVAIVRAVTDDEAMLAAAWLHDVVEDTAVTVAEILGTFGPDVGALVGWLTAVSRPADGDRATRKTKDRDHLAAAPARAQTIKVADLIDNTRSILARDPEFARIYVPEKRALLDVLVRADATLLDRARRQIEGALP